MERFIKEYANHQRNTIKNCEMIKEEIKEKALIKLDNILRAKERGYITVDEAIRSILEVLEY